MSLLLFLPMSCYLVAEISSETLSTGVGLFTKRSSEAINLGCDLLQQQADALWKNCGFHSCSSQPAIPLGPDWQIIPYRISVDSAAFHNFPEHGHYFEAYHYINNKLNADWKQCVTVTGSHWWIMQVVQNMNFTIRMFYTSHIGTINPSVCRMLSKLTYDTPPARLLLNCSNKLAEMRRNKTTHEIQLTIRISTRNILLSESIHKTIKLITKRINQHSYVCASVIRVMTSESGRARVVYVQIKGNKYSANGCALLNITRLDATRSGFITCEGNVIYHHRMNGIPIAVRLRLQGKLNGVPLHLMSNAELALRVEALLNFDKIGCITYEPGYTARLLKISEERLVLFISGPSSTDVCKQVKQVLREEFHKFYKSCVRETMDLVQPNEIRVSSYKLEANEPLYGIDEPLYLVKHAQLVYDLNKSNLSCAYNGYIQVDQVPDRQSDG